MRFLVLGLCLVATGLAQPSVARLEDPSGGAVTGARITAVNQMTGARTNVLSGQQGLYVFPSVPPGNYSVTVEASGFKKAVLTGVVLNVRTTVTAPIQLGLGAIAETINVEAKETAVQVADAEGGGVVAVQDIQHLPQAERNPIKLAIFQPGVQVMPGSIGFSNVNGIRIGSNEIKLDGLGINEPMSPALGFANRLPTDLVQEFRVTTYAGKAEYGRKDSFAPWCLVPAAFAARWLSLQFGRDVRSRSAQACSRTRRMERAQRDNAGDSWSSFRASEVLAA